MPFPTPVYADPDHAAAAFGVGDLTINGTAVVSEAAQIFTKTGQTGTASQVITTQALSLPDGFTHAEIFVRETTAATTALFSAASVSLVQGGAAARSLSSGISEPGAVSVDLTGFVGPDPTLGLRGQVFVNDSDQNSTQTYGKRHPFTGLGATLALVLTRDATVVTGTYTITITLFSDALATASTTMTASAA